MALGVIDDEELCKDLCEGGEEWRVWGGRPWEGGSWEFSGDWVGIGWGSGGSWWMRRS